MKAAWEAMAEEQVAQVQSSELSTRSMRYFANPAHKLETTEAGPPLRSVQVAFLFEAPSTVPSALGAMRRRRTDSAKINGLMPVSSGGRGTSWRRRPTVRTCRMSHWSEVAIGYSSNGRRLISREPLPRNSSQSEVDRTLVGRRAKTFLFSSYRASLDGSGTVRAAMCFHGHPGKSRYKRRSRISPRHCKPIRASRRTFFGHGPIPATMPTCAGTSA